MVHGQFSDYFLLAEMHQKEAKTTGITFLGLFQINAAGTAANTLYEQYDHDIGLQNTRQST